MVMITIIIILNNINRESKTYLKTVQHNRSNGYSALLLNFNICFACSIEFVPKVKT